MRREAPVTDGVEMAQLDFATPTNSDFGSNYSVMSEYPGYYSSQQHDEDYRVCHVTCTLSHVLIM